MNKGNQHDTLKWDTKNGWLDDWGGRVLAWRVYLLQSNLINLDFSHKNTPKGQAHILPTKGDVRGEIYDTQSPA